MELGAAPQLLVNGVLIGVFYAYLAVSWGIIFSTTKTFHFAHAVVITTGAYAAHFATAGGWSITASLVAAAGAAMLVGIAMEVGVYRPLRRRGAKQMNVFLAALGLVVAGAALFQILFGPNARRVRGFNEGGIRFGTVGFSRSLAYSVIVSLIGLAVVLIFVQYSRTGRAIRGVSSNISLSRTVGIPPQRIFVIVFAVGSAMAGVGGAVYALKNVATPNMGVHLVLVAAIGVFIGGIGSLKGAALGGFFLGIAENVGAIFLPGFLNTIVAFSLLLIVLVARPTGFFGRNVELGRAR
jgi:branched-chain amino acid transport system permease protein